MPKSDSPLTFADLIEQAQKTPTSSAALGVDTSSPFPLPLPDDHKIVNMDAADPIRVPGIPKYDFTAHVRYFILPKDIPAYEEVLNEVLGAHALLRYEERHFTKEGDCVVAICYLTYKPPVEKKDKDDEDEDEFGRPGN